ncbi:cyclophilin-like protein [Dunaliella salina]|uniref:Peptidyl-prolyl cis-trans isomerase n=1 Tax=Dunaliella salina TaxID=3046 RepID=A0ABQ7G6X6_DUNSA|nr:cyclophilin-like protein [Dunaliella salina]|eukprot:KAF5830356.1 cyclophilin-like protein [Dunaliella salina]
MHAQEGDVELGFFPDVAPITSQHIFTLCQQGLYTTNQFFRLDRGFVAQVSDVRSGRLLPLNSQQQEQAMKTVPLEVQQGVVHKAGVLSMGRYADPNSGTSSFSILLGDAPHLDMQYTIFGAVTKGMEVIEKLLDRPMKREGMFVMPIERTTIMSTYWYTISGPQPHHMLTVGSPGDSGRRCEEELQELKERFANQATEIEVLRKMMLP